MSTEMNLDEAITYLRPIAESATVGHYAEALGLVLAAAGVTQPKPEYEYGWELRETDSRDLFDWSDHWYPTESDAREGGAIAKRQSDADSPELPPLTFTVVRRVKTGVLEPVPNRPNV